MNFYQFYQQKIADKNYTLDKAQTTSSKALEQVFDNWLTNQHNLNLLQQIILKLSSLLSPQKTINHGIFLWGGVGRGKSFLMDNFYQYISTYHQSINSTRLHFHEFMRNIHKDLEKLRGQKNPIDIIAKNIAMKWSIVCFDEFHVNDIADAMIFDRLFHALFKYKIFFIMTSNYEPQKLYLHGLQRERFLPAISLLESNLTIINLDNGTDYRLRSLEQMPIYHTPITENTAQILQQTFDNLAQNHIDESNILHIENRIIKAKRIATSIAWFDFNELCNSPRSQNDYLEISLQFHTIILSDIPYMPPKMSSVARRFTWLVDVFYDNKVKLIISAHVPPQELYTEGTLDNEFHRTVSRLMEMQSKEYLALPKLH